MLRFSTALSEAASKSPLSFSTGCLENNTFSVPKSASESAPSVTKVTVTLPLAAFTAVVNSGLEVISVDPEYNLNDSS